MDFNTFFDLSLDEKIVALYKEGAFVVSIRYYGYKVNLYMFDGHYVEAFYNHKLDRIEKIEPLNPHHTRVKFYTDQIKLPKEISALV